MEQRVFYNVRTKFLNDVWDCIGDDNKEQYESNLVNHILLVKYSIIVYSWNGNSIVFWKVVYFLTTTNRQIINNIPIQF
jgi:hypothetical protein